MATMRWVILVSMVSTAPLRGEDAPAALRSTFEVRLHFFGDTHMVLRGDSGVISGAIQSAGEKRKSVGLAAVYSLLLPGIGELYAEGFSSGKYFLIAEGALWLTYATFEIYGNSLRDDARAYAVAHAGVNPAGKNDQFYIDLGNFLNVSDYNDKKLRDREPEKVYDPNAGYAWQWDSDAARTTFREQRISSENMYNNRKFVAAAILINHVASAINAARASISHNNALNNPLGDLQFSASVMGGWKRPHGIMITVAKGL